MILLEKSKTTLNKISKITMNEVLLIFILVQPLFDLYMGVIGENLDIFNFSIITLARIIIILALFLINLIKSVKNKVNLKITKIMIGYLAIVAIYSLIHHLNIKYSGSYFTKEGIYSFLTELLYVFRLVVPFIFIYTIVAIKPKRETIIKALIFSAAIISIIIVITNVFKVSFSSYFTEKVFIEGSVFSWIDLNPDQVNYKMYTSKGLFVSANQMAALLSILYFVVLYNTIKKQNIYMYITLIFQTIAMIMIGTRTANYGWKMAFVLLIIMFILKYLLKNKSSVSKKTIIILTITLFLGFFLGGISPANYRDFAKDYESEYENNLKQKQASTDYLSPDTVELYLKNDQLLLNHLKVTGSGYNITVLRKNFLNDYILNNYAMHFIPQIYIEQIYPYQEDPIFWINMFNLPLSAKGDNRARQILIVKRIKEKNENKTLDTMFGMGATPLNIREFMIEKDIVSHYYNLGIVGIIVFVCPYLFMILYVFKDKVYVKIQELIKTKKSKNIFESTLYIFIVLTAYLISYFSGHVIDEYIVSIYLATITALLVITAYEEE